MALPVISVDDFKGWFKIVANQFKEEDLEEYILLFRERYLRQLVGDAAYIDIESQTRQKWADLLQGVDYIDIEGKRKRYDGLVKSLFGFIYFEFVRDNFTSTQTGRVKGKSENSERAHDLEILNVARARFNQGVRRLDSVCSFLEANFSFSENVVSSIDNADNTYTLTMFSTKYLEAGDSLSIGGVEHETISVTADTAIVIDAGQIGLDFTDMVAVWEPYEDVDFELIDLCGI